MMGREDWLLRKEAVDLPDESFTPPPPPMGDKPALDDAKPGLGADKPEMPELPELPQRSLGDIAKEREMSPPPVANPTGVPEETKPMSSKELLSVVGNAAKALFDAKLTLEKAVTGLSKVTPMASPSARDKETAEKAKSLADSIKNMGDSIEALAEEVSAFRKDLSEPRSPWTE